MMRQAHTGNRLATAAVWLSAALPQLALGQERGGDVDVNSRTQSVQALDPVRDRLNEATANLSPAERSVALVVYENLSEKGRLALVSLAERSSTEEPLLKSTDSNEGTLLENLSTIVSQKFHKDFQSQRTEIIDDFVNELAHPGELNQAGFGVCGVGLIYQLYLEQPAEASRLMAGLLSEEPGVKTRAGDTMTLASYVADPDPFRGRSISEKIFQSALMELANGLEKAYCNHCDEHFSMSSGEIFGKGLYQDQIQHLYESIFDVKMSSFKKGDKTSEELLELVQADTASFTPVSLRWSSSFAGTKLKRIHILSPDESGTLGNEPHHKLAGGSYRYGRDGNHFVTITRVEDGRVYYRNLHGPSSHRVGAVLSNPPRRVENPKIGLESISVDEFKKRVNWIMTLNQTEEEASAAQD